MKQRLVLSSAGAAAVLAFCVVWFATVAKPIYGMDRLPEVIRQAKSYEYTMTTEMTVPQEPGKPSAKVEMKGRFFWVAPGSYRIENQVEGSTMAQDLVTILPAGKPGIEIDRKTKKYVSQPARLGQVSPLMMLDKLSTFSGHADRGARHQAN